MDATTTTAIQAAVRKGTNSLAIFRIIERNIPRHLAERVTSRTTDQIPLTEMPAQFVGSGPSGVSRNGSVLVNAEAPARFVSLSSSYRLHDTRRLLALFRAGEYGDFAQIEGAMIGGLRGRTRSISSLSVKTSDPVGLTEVQAMENSYVGHRLTTRKGKFIL